MIFHPTAAPPCTTRAPTTCTKLHHHSRTTARPRSALTRRGIGLTDEERASAADELAKEEADRLSQTAEEKEARAQRELDRLTRLTDKAAALRRRMIAERAKGSGVTDPTPRAEGAGAAHEAEPLAKNTAANPSGSSSDTEPESELIRRARAIGISEEERAAHALELEAEEEQRLAEPKSAKQARAERELEKLNRQAEKRNKEKKAKKDKTKKKKRKKSSDKTEL
jgi:hypothetical protein